MLCGPATLVRVYNPRWEVTVEVGALYGGAAGVARRLRGEGLQARVVRGEVVVQAMDG